jgi:hypothetical protein
MGVLTTAGKNAALDGFRTSATHMGLQTKGPNITGVTGVTSTDTFTKTAHGLVVLSGLTGGSGLVAGDPYFVVSTAANTFQLALTPGGSAVDLGSDVTAATVNKLTEITGGTPAYARKAIAWNAAAAAVLDDSTNGAAFDVPPGAVVDYQSLHTASTAGSVLAIDDVTQETFGGQGTYTATDFKVNAIS